MDEIGKTHGDTANQRLVHGGRRLVIRQLERFELAAAVKHLRIEDDGTILPGNHEPIWLWQLVGDLARITCKTSGGSGEIVF